MSEKKTFSWDNLSAGTNEFMQQWLQPWGDVVKKSWEQTRDLQDRLMNRTQEALQQSYEMGMEGFKQSTQAVQKFQELAQEQWKRFTHWK